MLKRLARWFLERHGYVVVHAGAWDQVSGHLDEISRLIGGSGHLNTVSGRSPKVIRKLDRHIGAAQGLANWASNTAA